MGKIVKGIVLGAAVGAGIRLAQDLKGEDDLGAIAPRVAKTAGEAALAGAAVGATAAGGAAKLKLLAESGVAAAVPVLQHAAEVAIKQAREAADTAKPHVVHAAEVATEWAEERIIDAKPHVEKASKQARKRAKKAADQARPKIEAAAKDARKRADNVADLATEKAKRKLAELDLPVVVAV